MTLIDESERLHERVRAFATETSSDTETFDRLALNIAEYQLRWSTGYRQLVEERGGLGRSPEDIPAVPTDAFRLTRVAVHPPELDEVRFLTSGTTGDRGLHALRTTRTYRVLAQKSGVDALCAPGTGRHTVVALAPQPGDPPSSSLGFMMRLFMECLDGRPLVRDPGGVGFDPLASGRWLAARQGLDVEGLSRAALLARDRQEPLLVLATSFALVLLLDALGGARLPAPRRTVVMQTGGFKGRTREVAPQQLRSAVAQAFCIPESQVVDEYGMTELTSQLYGRAPSRVYREPPWLRVVPVHQVTLEPLADEEVGLARIVDLGNVDSAVAVLTQDLVRRRAGGIELCGRRRGAPPRGCSLAVEALVHVGAGVSGRLEP